MKYFVLLFFLLTGCQTDYSQPEISAIAHAGGGIHGKRYTNSMEALEYNYERGFELFEIDFVWTTDKNLACLHDWKNAPKWLLNYRDKTPISLTAFNQLKNEKLNLTPCNLERLNQWLKTHPNSYIVTDIRGKNMAGLTLISNQIDDFQHRIIPQIKQPEEFKLSQDLGYKTIIWTLYSFKGDNDAVVKHAKNLDLFAITMPPKRAKQGLAKQLKPLKVPTYVHTINDFEEALDYQNTYGLTSVYTDFLTKDLSE